MAQTPLCCSELSHLTDEPVLLPLPFPATANWQRCCNTWSILQDESHDKTGAISRWCDSKWGPNNVVLLSELADEKTMHGELHDKLLLWTKRAWRIVWIGTLDYLPPIACDLIISVISPPFTEAVDDCTLEEKVTLWRNLSREYHNDQLNLCRFYAQVDDDFLVEGLRLWEMKYEHAPLIAHQIRTVTYEGNPLLCSAYTLLLNKQVVAPVDEEDIVKPLRYESEDDLSLDLDLRASCAPYTALASNCM